MTAPDADEFTELYDATMPRVDLVGNGASGVPRWLIAKSGGSAGVLDPEFVRGLIAKSGPAEPERSGRERVEMPNGIVLSGSSEGVADFMARVHKAAGRARERDTAGFSTGAAYVEVTTDTSQFAGNAVADYEAVIKAKYSAGDKQKMLAAGHAIANEDGDPAYPIGDKDDLGKAIPAVGRGGPDHDRIRAYVIKRAKALGAASEIPDNWNADGSLKQPVSKEEAPVAAVAKDLMDAAGDSVGLDDGTDGLDPTVPLATPADEDIPGDPTDPGSPAWESIDAATAQKWTGILARAQYAVGLLAEREMLEAASADPDDAENACDLSTVCDALDYAISVLAPFAVGEQSEADCGAMEMAAIGKAAGMLRPGDLRVIEGFAAVRKAGRVLSKSNEDAIRGAVDSLQKVLASLPEAPVAKKKEGATMPETPAAQVAKETTPEQQAADTGPVNAGGTTGPAAALPGDGPLVPLPGDAPGRTVVKSAGLQVVVYDRPGRPCITTLGAIRQPVAKADSDAGDEKPKMQAVFDQDGDLIGVVDPAAITPVAGASAPAANDGSEPQADPADDMEPQPSADAGTPAAAVGKSAGAPAEPEAVTLQDVLKAISQSQAAFGAQQVTLMETVVKAAAAGKEELAAEVATLKSRLETVEAMPAVPGVFSNGATPPRDAVPPPAPQLRGQDQGVVRLNVAKAQERKAELYSAHGPEQARIAKEMQADAIGALAAMHAARH